MRVRFTGGTPAVDLALPGDRWLRCERGQIVEVSDEIGGNLVMQADWESADPPKSPRGGRTDSHERAVITPDETRGGE